MWMNGRSAKRALRAALCCALCLGIVLGAEALVRAEAPPPAATGELQAGTILQLDGADVVLDLGAAQLDREQQLTVYRAIEVRHPISGKRLRDRFAIGHLRVIQTGQTLSIARAVDAPAHPLAVGDRVRFLPRDAAPFDGTVARLLERTAEVELLDPASPAVAGMRAIASSSRRRLPQMAAGQRSRRRAQRRRPKRTAALPRRR